MSELNHLAELVRAVATGEPAPAWCAAEPALADERERVLRHLADHPDQAVYGFTTLLGPLDNHPSDQAELAQVVRAHLIGDPKPLHESWCRAIHGAKLAQLAQGGSGVSAESYRRALDTFGTPFATDLDASYGSGDVVPTSWWLVGTLGLDALQRGDYIALINGCFLGVGAATMALARFEALLAEAVGLLTLACDAHAPLAPEGWRRELLAALAVHHPATHPDVQRSVVQRDLGAHLLPLLDSVMAAERALDNRLGQPSGNPLFVRDGDAVRPVSQSSFLALDVRLALEPVLAGAHLLSGLLQRCAEFGAEHDRNTEADPLELRWVQPPKVSQAISLKVGRASQGIGFTGSQSGGVEDLWDGVLVRALDLDGVVDLLQKQVELLVRAGHRRVPTARVRELLAPHLVLSGLEGVSGVHAC